MSIFFFCQLQPLVEPDDKEKKSKAEVLNQRFCADSRPLPVYNQLSPAAKVSFGRVSQFAPRISVSTCSHFEWLWAWLCQKNLMTCDAITRGAII